MHDAVPLSLEVPAEPIPSFAIISLRSEIFLVDRKSSGRCRELLRNLPETFVTIMVSCPIVPE